MNFNYKKARDLMVENQLRPNKIKNLEILSIFRNIEKEKFLPDEYKNISYSDMDIDMGNNRGYLKNLHIAQLINGADIENNHKILHIGALTGYVSAILSKISSQVYVIETNKKHKLSLESNIKELNLTNIEIVDGSFEAGFKSEFLFDIVFIDNPINNLNNIIKEQISDNLGKIIMIKKNSDYLSKAIKITKNKNNFSEEYLFDVFSKYELFQNMEEFIF